MRCPKCGYKYSAVIIYGHCEDENGNEYPYDKRVYETGGSLPNWGVEQEYNGYYYHGGKWPTRFCYECRTRFAYEPENIAMGVDREDAVNIANQEAQQVNQWESMEKMQEEFPYMEFGWFGFYMIGFDRSILNSEEEEIAEQLHRQ